MDFHCLGKKGSHAYNLAILAGYRHAIAQIHGDA
jgi:hypothetical protein